MSKAAHKSTNAAEIATRRVDIGSVRCIKCRMEGSLDDAGRCEFCRRATVSTTSSWWSRVKQFMQRTSEAI